MTRIKRVLIALMALAAMSAAIVPAGAAVRMRVTGRRTTDPVVMYVPRRATLLATGHYAEAFGLPAPYRQYDDYYNGGPVYHGSYGGAYDGYYGPYGGYVTPPPYTWGHSPLDSPLPIPY